MTYWQIRLTELKQGQQIEAIRVMDREFDNIRAAWDWALKQRDFQSIDPMIDVIYTYCQLRGWINVGIQLFDSARQRLAPQDGEAVHPTWGRTLVRCRPYDANHLDIIEQALAIARQYQNVAEEAFCLHQKGWQVDHNDAATFFEQSKSLYEKINDPYHVAHNLMAIANIALRNGRGDVELPTLKQAETLMREIGDEDGLASVLILLGWYHGGHGEFDEEERLYREALAIYKKIGNQKQIISMEGYTLAVLVLWTKLDTTIEAAALRYLESAKYYHEPVSQARALDILSMVALLREDYDRCLELIDEALPLIGDGFIHQNLMRSWADVYIAKGDFSEIPQALVKRMHYYRFVSSLPKVLRDFSHYAAWLAYQGEKAKAQKVLSFALQHPASPSKWLKAMSWLKNLNIPLVPFDTTGYTVDSLADEILQLDS